MRWVLIVALLPRLLAASGTTAADLARSVREAGLDPDECYRIRDLSFSRDDLRFYLTAGYLVFGKAVNGVRSTAVFAADAEGGDAEVLVLPPHRSERMSLASYTGSPNLDEHFTAAVLIFADETYATLLDQLRTHGAKKIPDMGRLLAEKWNGPVRNLVASVQVRLVEDLLSAPSRADGFFYGALTGRELGNFDVIYDPQLREQIKIGQVGYRNQRPYYNIWTSFAAAPFRKGTRPTPGLAFRLSDFRLEATLEPNLDLQVTTRVAVTPEEREQALAFDISSLIRVTGARIDGEPAEVFQPDSLRANLVRDTGNNAFLLVPAKPLEKGRRYEVEFQQEGNVISDAGNHVYFVDARVNWYPNRALQFARYDLIFRYPRNLDLVATGQIVEDRTEGDWRMTRRRTEAPVRIAAFNLGEYQRIDLARAGYKVEVCANRQLEPGLRPKPQPPVMLPPRTSPFPGANRRAPEILQTPPSAPAPDPTARLKQLGADIVSSLEFMTAEFGPLPLRTITVAPIPGAFGQGFAGLVYLSTMAYLDPAQRPLGNGAHERFQQTFFSELLQAHEIAHQWWGNVVTTSEQQDEWLMEALANYSALLYLEKRKGPRAVESVLEDYRHQLLSKTADGKTLESTGPITWGARLSNSQAPDGWRAIIYAKGSWIMHMLRRRLGDKPFLAMLGELRRGYEYHAVTTEQFRELARKYVPPQSPDPKLESFFDEWVYGTGIPTLRLKYTVSGKAPDVKLSGSVTQTDVDESFSVPVPIEVQLGKGKSVTHWVRTGDEPVTFTVKLRQPPAKVLLDPSGTVLAVRK